MERPYKYITVLNYENGQVYLYDYDATTMPNAEEFVSNHHNLDNVHYMVHKWPPALWVKDLYYCTREEIFQLNDEEDE